MNSRQLLDHMQISGKDPERAKLVSRLKRMLRWKLIAKHKDDKHVKYPRLVVVEPKHKEDAA